MDSGIVHPISLIYSQSYQLAIGSCIIYEIKEDISELDKFCYLFRIELVDITISGKTKIMVGESDDMVEIKVKSDLVFEESMTVYFNEFLYSEVSCLLLSMIDDYSVIKHSLVKEKDNENEVEMNTGLIDNLNQLSFDNLNQTYNKINSICSMSDKKLKTQLSSNINVKTRKKSDNYLLENGMDSKTISLLKRWVVESEKIVEFSMNIMEIKNLETTAINNSGKNVQIQNKIILKSIDSSIKKIKKKWESFFFKVSKNLRNRVGYNYNSYNQRLSKL